MNEVKQINPNAFLIGELWHKSNEWLQGDKFDAVLNYPLLKAMIGFFINDGTLTEEETKVLQRLYGNGNFGPFSAEQFAERLKDTMEGISYNVALVQINLLGSHDTPRIATIARGSKNPCLKLLYLCAATFPGTLSIYYGDEIGMEGANDPDCRRSFPWQDETRWDKELLVWIKKVIKLRNLNTCLRHGQYKTLYTIGKCFAFSRFTANEIIITAFNLEKSEQIIHVKLDQKYDCQEFINLLDTSPTITAIQSTLKLVIPSQTAVVWKS